MPDAAQRPTQRDPARRRSIYDLVDRAIGSVEQQDQQQLHYHQQQQQRHQYHRSLQHSTRLSRQADASTQTQPHPPPPLAALPQPSRYASSAATRPHATIGNGPPPLTDYAENPKPAALHVHRQRLPSYSRKDKSLGLLCERYGYFVFPHRSLHNSSPSANYIRKTAIDKDSIGHHVPVCRCSYIRRR
jgi:hypothetical protein